MHFTGGLRRMLTLISKTLPSTPNHTAGPWPQRLQIPAPDTHMCDTFPAALAPQDNHPRPPAQTQQSSAPFHHKTLPALLICTQSQSQTSRCAYESESPFPASVHSASAATYPSNPDLRHARPARASPPASANRNACAFAATPWLA